MSPKTSPTLAFGLVLCGAGIIWQWPASVDAHPIEAGPDRSPSARDHRVSEKIASSSRPRKISKRRPFFPFEEIRPGTTAHLFLQRHPELIPEVKTRNENVFERRVLMREGLGRKHPDILELDQSIEKAEDKVLGKWTWYRKSR
jgi:hypothetical protein